MPAHITEVPPTPGAFTPRIAPDLRRAALRVVAVADDGLMAEALVTLLERSGRIRAERATSPWEVRSSLSRNRASAVLWEAWHADRDVLAEADAVRRELDTPVCVVAKTIDVEALRELFASRADGLAIILRRRDIDSADLFRVLVQLVTGRVVLSPFLLEQLIRDAPSARDDRLGCLTTAELGVLELIAAGLRNGEIARRLGRSQKLVEKHISRTFSKLGLSIDDNAIDRRVTAVRMFLLATADIPARRVLDVVPQRADASP